MNNTFINEVGTPSAPQFWEAVMRGSLAVAGQTTITVLNVLHFCRVTGPGTMTAAELGALLLAAIDDELAAAMTEDCSYTEIDVRPMDDPLVAPTAVEISLVGTQAVETLPGYACVTLRKQCYGRGRNFRGSIHFAGIAEPDTNVNVLDGGGTTLWQAVANGLMTLCTPFAVGSGGDQCRLAVLSPTLSNFTSNPGTFSGSFIKTDGVVLNTTLGTMRRRKMGVGT